MEPLKLGKTKERTHKLGLVMIGVSASTANNTSTSETFQILKAQRASAMTSPTITGRVGHEISANPHFCFANSCMKVRSGFGNSLQALSFGTTFFTWTASPLEAWFAASIHTIFSVRMPALLVSTFFRRL